MTLSSSCSFAPTRGPGTFEFGAVHMSANGTKRTSQDVDPFVRFRAKADIHDGVASTASVADDPEQTSNDVRSPRCLRRLYNDTAREARSNPGGIPNRRTGNGKCHRKIAPGFRTGKNEPAAAHSALAPR